MNMLIYCENGNLTIRKPNGLEYTFENTDKPELGFDYDVLVYDDIEVKILKWKDNTNFEDQEKINLVDTEVDAIETYIKNSAPAEGVSLQNQYSSQLQNMCSGYIAEQADSYGFTDMMDVVASGREGSNHPLRSDARRVLEYYDAVWNVYLNVVDEIRNTREDTLREFSEYSNQIPSPQKALID